MKHKVIIFFCTGIMLLSGCTQKTQNPVITEPSDETTSKPTTELTIHVEQPTKTTTLQPEAEQSAEPTSVAITETSTYKEQITDTTSELPTTTIESPAENIITEELTIGESPKSYPDDTIYIGEYLDSVANSTNLKIAKGDNGTYLIQIGIFRLTFIDDCIGELTEEGMNFTGTDAAGNPISGIITVENQTATVTFTNSTWDYLKSGSSFEYIKSSDVPNLYE